MQREIFSEATNVDAEDGNVTLDGPDGIDVHITPEAAEATSERLQEGAMKARGQSYLKNNPRSLGPSGKALKPPKP